MKKYLLSTILATVLAGGLWLEGSLALAKSPSKHDDLVINVALPAQPAPAPAPAPAPVAEPTPIIINNTATATNNNYPVNTNNIDLDLINSIKDLVKEMSAEKCKEAKSKAYPYKTSWTDYGQSSNQRKTNGPVATPKKYYFNNDFSNYEWVWGPYQDGSTYTDYANYNWENEWNGSNGNNTNYENIDWESEWNSAWDDGWSNGWDTGWDDAFNYMQSNEWNSGSGDNGNGSSTTTEQSTYSI